MHRPRSTTASTTAAAATAVVLATTGGLLAVVAAPASAAAPACAAPEFTREVFANTTFSGTPVRTDCDGDVDEDWGRGAPAGLRSNHFGVRWTLTRDFGSGGPFTLAVSGQDGIRVHLDGERRIDLWKDIRSTVSGTVELNIPSGEHTLRVDYANWTGAANVKFAYAPASPAADRVVPLAPTGLVASYDETSGRAGLSWAPNREMDLAGYRVYRRDPGAAEPALASGPALLTGTSFAEGLPATGASYAYEVRAVDRAGNESAGSAAAAVTTADRTAPHLTAPTAAHDNWTGVDLEWGGDPDAVSYDVERASSPTGDFTRLATVDAPAHRDATAPYGETSYYRVTARDAAGNTATSPVLEFSRPLAVPHLDGVRDARTGLEVSWTSPVHGPAEFRVYRWEGSGTPEPVVCAPAATGGPDDPDPRYACVDTTAEIGRTYSYRVHTVDAQGRESEPSQTGGATRADATPPPAVTGLTHTNTEYGTVLRWDANPAADLAAYDVYRVLQEYPGMPGTGTPERIGTVAAGTTEYADVQVVDDQTWTYYVDAVDTDGNSLARQETWDQVTHEEVNEYYLSPSWNPGYTYDWTLEVSANSVGQAELSWSCSDNCAATGFNVRRWDRATEDWVLLTQQPLPAGTSTWTDPGTPRGTTSHYVVSAVAADGSETYARWRSVATPPA
ncbi:PA14 domain-containing protein [Streptomyces sp. NPDC053367]|uniref:PA14 domain-containing protein n=1 Tax=Streptomyces sp. NPDC053367 TaxID=3365700 RepID=UPI0037D04DB8